MNTARVRNAYRQSESQGKIHPVKLIHMMYERLLDHLAIAEEGVLEGDLQKRGESLGKAIAILSELNVSIRDDDNSEAAQFLSGLYGAILAELPKVAVDNDVDILRQSRAYIQSLKGLWEQTAMKEEGIAVAATPPQTEGKVDTQVHRPSSKTGTPAVSVSI